MDPNQKNQQQQSRRPNVSGKPETKVEPVVSVKPEIVVEAAPVAEVASEVAPAVVTSSEVVAEVATEAAPKIVTETERLMGEVATIDAEILALKGEIAKATEAEDDKAIGALSQQRASLRAKREGKINALGGARFAPDLNAAIIAAIDAGSVKPPEGRYSLVSIFEGGKCIGTRVLNIEGASGIPSAARQAGPAVVRSNFQASGGRDARHPSPGWSKKLTSRKVEWVWTYLANGNVRAISATGEVLENTPNTVARLITNQPTNVYELLDLGKPGSTWDDAKPLAGWTKAG